MVAGGGGGGGGGCSAGTVGEGAEQEALASALPVASPSVIRQERDGLRRPQKAPAAAAVGGKGEGTSCEDEDVAADMVPKDGGKSGGRK